MPLSKVVKGHRFFKIDVGLGMSYNKALNDHEFVMTKETGDGLFGR